MELAEFLGGMGRNVCATAATGAEVPAARAQPHMADIRQHFDCRRQNKTLTFIFELACFEYNLYNPFGIWMIIIQVLQ